VFAGGDQPIADDLPGRNEGVRRFLDVAALLSGRLVATDLTGRAGVRICAALWALRSVTGKGRDFLPRRGGGSISIRIADRG